MARNERAFDGRRSRTPRRTRSRSQRTLAPMPAGTAPSS